MPLSALNNNMDQQIILPEKIDEIKVKNIADELESSFVIDKDQLMAVLSIFGISIEQLLRSISEFFLKKIKINQLTIHDIENIDLRKLAYDFILETGITKPKFSSPQERALAINMFFKLGRIYLHEILFPELIEINPNLAYSVLNLLKRTISSICVAEQFDKKEAFSKLMLDAVDIPLPKLLSPQSLQREKNNAGKIKYIKIKSITDNDLTKIAKQLYSDHAAINKKSSFIHLLNSQGEEIEPVEIPNSKIKLVVHLFYRMFHPYNRNQKKLICMNKGKGYWKFIQQNIVDETGNTFPRLLKKISSEINNDPKCQQIKDDVKNILDPIYNKQNKK